MRDRTLAGAVLLGLGSALLILWITLASPPTRTATADQFTVVAMRQADIDSFESDRLGVEFVTDLQALLDRVAAGRVTGAILDAESARRIPAAAWPAFSSDAVVVVVDMQGIQLDALRRGEEPPASPPTGGLSAGRFFAYRYRVTDGRSVVGADGTRPLATLEDTLMDVAARLPR